MIIAKNTRKKVNIKVSTFSFSCIHNLVFINMTFSRFNHTAKFSILNESLKKKSEKGRDSFA